MKKATYWIKPILAACGLFVLILDAKSAIQGAQEGVELCIKTLIPSLFPFFVISGYFCRVCSTLNIPFLKPIMRICGMPDGTESLLIIGMLGGYPVGAKAIADAYYERRIHIGDAKRLLGFCSNAGPAFVFGVIGALFEDRWVPWILLLILITSGIITGWLLPKKNNRAPTPSKQQTISFHQIFEGSIKAIASVCAWVILFRVFINISKRWFLWLLPTAAQVAITGTLELSNGCIALSAIRNEGLRFMISAGILSFGGLCVYLQTVSVTRTLGTGLYFPGKMLQCFISLTLSGAAQCVLFSQENRMPPKMIIPFLCITITISIIKAYMNKKTVAFPEQMMYNTVKYQ